MMMISRVVVCLLLKFDSSTWMDPKRSSLFRRQSNENDMKVISVGGRRLIRPFLINFVDTCQFLPVMKDHMHVHVVPIPIHLYISILESIKITRRTKIFNENLSLTSTSRSFCRRSSDRSDVDKDSGTIVFSLLYVLVDELFLIVSLE